MVIRTKHNIGDKIPFEANNALVEAEIINISIECNEGHHTSIFYTLKFNNGQIIKVAEYTI